MIFQDDIAEQSKLPFPLEITPGFKNDFDGFRTSEDGQPAHDGAGEEIRVFGLFLRAMLILTAKERRGRSADDSEDGI